MSLWERLRSGRSSEQPPSEPATQRASSSTSSADAPDTDSQSVAGERGIPSIHRTRSLQSRLSSLLALGLLSVLALGFLAWYYTQVFARQSRAQADAQSATKTQAKGEMSLPALGRVDPPVVERVLGPPPELPRESPTLLPTSIGNAFPTYAAASPYGAASTKTPEQLALERRLSGPVFVSAVDKSSPSTSRAPSVPTSTEAAVSPLTPMPAASQEGGARDSGALASLLQPTATPAAQAKVLPTQRLLLAKGSFLDCTLETAIDSSLPGMTTCITATDTFSVDGAVVLLERGTKLVGETRGEVRQGTARVYVLWTEARTPTGVVVPLASPGTDELGRAGLPGEVNRHFWQRFGAAILVSVIDGVVQSAVQQSSDGDGTVIVNPSTSSDVMTEILRSTISIPPTVTKQNGDRIAVLVARDLDFRPVYELRPTAGR